MKKLRSHSSSEREIRLKTRSLIADAEYQTAKADQNRKVAEAKADLRLNWAEVRFRIRHPIAAITTWWQHEMPVKAKLHLLHQADQLSQEPVMPGQQKICTRSRSMHEVGAGDFVKIKGVWKQIVSNTAEGVLHPPEKNWAIVTTDGKIYDMRDIDLYAKAEDFE